MTTESLKQTMADTSFIKRPHGHDYPNAQGLVIKWKQQAKEKNDY
jgi:hypothetical protein